jgi:glutaminyl-tRNA synthetase
VPHALSAEVRLYDTLFTLKDMSKMEEGKTYEDYLNPESLVILKDCKVEPSLEKATPEDRFQFMRQGYFVPDRCSTPEHLLFNRIVSLKDSWKKIAAKG